MAQKKCPTCPFSYDTDDKYAYRECTECGARFCNTCAGKHEWKCPACKSPTARLERSE